MHLQPFLDTDHSWGCCSCAPEPLCLAVVSFTLTDYVLNACWHCVLVLDKSLIVDVFLGGPVGDVVWPVKLGHDKKLLPLLSILLHLCLFVLNLACIQGIPSSNDLVLG